MEQCAKLREEVQEQTYLERDIRRAQAIQHEYTDTARKCQGLKKLVNLAREEEQEP